jgi:hypothetical protein
MDKIIRVRGSVAAMDMAVISQRMGRDISSKANKTLEAGTVRIVEAKGVTKVIWAHKDSALGLSGRQARSDRKIRDARNLALLVSRTKVRGVKDLDEARTDRVGRAKDLADKGVKVAGREAAASRFGKESHGARANSARKVMTTVNI